ncbi:MAG: glycosyltransferase family A protein [Ferruginibacter sp.]
MKINQPLVSVLMTAYNREEFISEAIESVLTSTYTNFELIVVDDCSKDNTVSIARLYESKDSRIRVYENEKNLGDYPNRNKAASYATGKYLKYCDSDDKLFDWSLEYCVDMMETYPEAGMGILKLNKEVQEEYLLSKDAIYKNFFEQSILSIGPSGTILKREAFQRTGCFNPEFGVASDMYFNLKIAAHFPIVFLPKVFFFYRTHEGQELNNTYSYLYNSYRYLNQALVELRFELKPEKIEWLHKKNKRRFIVNVFSYFLKSFNLKKTIIAIKRADFSFKDAIQGVLH